MSKANYDNLGFNINFDVKNLDKVNSAIEALTKLQNFLSTFKTIDLTALNETADALDRVASSARAVNSVNLKTFEKKFNGIKDIVGGTANATEKLKQTLEDAMEDVKPLTVEVEKLGGDDEEEVTPQTVKVPKFSSEMGSFSNAVSNVLKVMGNVASITGKVVLKLNSWLHLTTIIGTATKRILLMPFTGMKSIIDGVVNSFQRFTKRLMRLTITKALRRAITLVSQGIKEGTDNLYQYSKAMGTDFAKSMDMASTSLLYFKNSIGAMLAPLMNVLAPVIDAVIDRVVELINVVNQFFARITGADHWTRAIKYVTQYAEATSNANNNVKKFSSSLDELNILDNSSSGGSGSGANDPSLMFEDLALDAGSEWEQFVQNAIENGNWGRLGELFAQKINEVIGGIDFVGSGRNLAGKLNDVFEFAFNFISNLGFGDWGRDLGTFLNSLFGDLDTEQIGRTLGSAFQGVIDFAYNFLTTMDWELLGSKVADYFLGFMDMIDFIELMDGVNKVVEAILTFLKGFLSNREKWKDIITRIITSVGQIDIGKIILGILEIAEMLLDILLDKKVIDALNKAILEMIEKIDIQKIIKVLQQIVKQIIHGVFTIGNSVSETLSNELANAVEGATGSSTAGNVARNVTQGLTGGALSWMNEDLQEFVSEVNNRGVVSQIWELVTKGASNARDNVKGSVDGMRRDMLNAFGLMTVDVSSFSGNMNNSFSNITKGVSFDGLKDSFTSAVGQFPELMRRAMDGLPSAIESKIPAISTAFNKIPDNAKSAYNALITFGETVANRTIDAVQSMLDSMSALGGVSVNGQLLEQIKVPNLGGHLNLQRLAKGGMLSNNGSLFIAGEQGAEWVGNFGGNTGVMNTDEMASAVSKGVYDAIMASNSDGNQTININLDGRTIWTNQTQVGRERGFNLGLGGFV